MGVLMNLGFGDGSKTVFKLGNNADVDHLGTPRIFKDNTPQTVTTDYSISGYDLTFVVAPSAGVLVRGDYSTLDRN